MGTCFLYEVVYFHGMFPRETAETKPQLMQFYNYWMQSERVLDQPHGPPGIILGKSLN